ncbi:hypothetical protein [Rubricoccus marinus]|uniref:Uncharacterized protein n=1 Tax=Rubricoccus marinus TaxID=716817 RepID=A0A259TY37_9BACT|nr:hypothetical protein [Rubricoccus marinus]OZC02621.1 hypothetical protein BSZ36_06310 [Rubricoccus marinus]
MFPVLRPILNKGGAGNYISREESVDRLVPVVADQLGLLRDYDYVAKRLDAPAVRQRFEEVVLPNVRTELNKLYETIFSLGGSAPTGADMDWSASGLDGNDTDSLKTLLERDRAFGDRLRDEVEAVHHQERTRAILGHNADKSNDRLNMLRALLADLG